MSISIVAFLISSVRAVVILSFLSARRIVGDPVGKFFIIMCAFLFLPCAVLANTYYVDYQSGSDTNAGTSKLIPWKRHPYMQGFGGSYAHAAGDIFIFKGGVTWAYSLADPLFPINIKAGGATGNPDQYTVDKTWYVGSSWTPPVLDGGQQYTGGSGTATLGANSYIIGDYIYNPSNLVIDNLQIQNIGDPSTATGTCIQIQGGGSSIEIKNCILSPQAVQAFAYSNGVSNSTSQHIYIHNNQIMNAGRGVIYGFQGSVVNDVQVYANQWQGLTRSYVFHGDGLMIGCPTSSCSNTGPATVTNIQFYDNLFYGLWAGGATAQYFAVGNTSGTEIYNNVFAIEDTSCPSGGCLSPGFVSTKGDDTNMAIYNNTFSSDSDSGKGNGTSAAAISLAAPAEGYLTIEGNIFSGVWMDISTDLWPTGSSVTMDYNLHNGPTYWVVYGGFSGAGTYKCNSSSTCQPNGVEAHSLSGIPQFVSIPNGTVGSGNWHLQPSSPARGTSANLTSLNITTLDVDILGGPRPPSGPWDVGAYEYRWLAAPTNFRIAQ
jgi:hypothetical protein